MEIRVGLTDNDLTKLVHKSATVTSATGVHFATEDDPKAVRATTVTITAQNNILKVAGATVAGLKPGTALLIRPNGSSVLMVPSLSRPRANGKSAPYYAGTIEIKPAGDEVRIILLTTLESYVEGVLQSEIPASYEMEAIKAQAVAARTYALRPRLSHKKDFANVCDSYLCCQYFGGAERISARHATAIKETANQILKHEGEPILALFSSNAGGCTEDYENCFSDPDTGAFPPPPLPYLLSESEGTFKPNLKTITESDLRKIYFDKSFQTADSWSPNFRWTVHMPANALEAHMHHEIEVLMADKSMAPFIVPPKSGKFGHIHSFQIDKRGTSGTAVEMTIETSTGNWLVKKELVIRSVFKNRELSLARLRSAKIFFEFKHDTNNLLTHVTVNGMGYGHGVGMQQTGAQGWAKRGKTYKDILAHYFRGTVVTSV